MNDTLHRLSGELLRSQDQERRRIARDLHDSTGQLLAGLGMLLARLDDPDLPCDRKSSLVTQCRELVSQCTREVRALSYLMHPPLLDEFGLTAALHTLVDGFVPRTGIVVELEAAENFERLDRELEIAMFRIAQEALGNIHRHSGSSSATIRLTRNGESVALEVEDHGKGLHNGPQAGSEPQFGVGILGMRERARQLRGSLEVIDNGGGVTVRAVFPLA